MRNNENNNRPIGWGIAGGMIVPPNWNSKKNSRIKSGGLNMDKKAFLVAKVWVYFGYNYPDVEGMIDYICKQNGEGEMFKKHLMGKWNSIYDDYGCHAVMNRFFAELSETYRQALVDYAIKFYAPTAFHWTDEEKEILGINK